MKLAKLQLRKIIMEEVNEALSRREAEVLAWITPAVQGLLSRLDSRLKAGRISPTEHQQSLDDAMEDATEANLERGEYDSIDDYVIAHCRSFEEYGDRPNWFEDLKSYLDSEEVKLGDDAQACMSRYTNPVSERKIARIIKEELEQVLKEIVK
tara:strand:+ start:603 stop:1061 length:459 start_codon:yes stop_codon:yes gene_type:complete